MFSNAKGVTVTSSLPGQLGSPAHRVAVRSCRPEPSQSNPRSESAWVGGRCFDHWILWYPTPLSFTSEGHQSFGTMSPYLGLGLGKYQSTSNNGFARVMFSVLYLFQHKSTQAWFERDWLGGSISGSEDDKGSSTRCARNFSANKYVRLR